jgi:RNA polymerase sigma-70 factor (ECF subfamily)
VHDARSPEQVTSTVLAMVAPFEARAQDDHVVVARLVAGDDRALADVYDRHAAMVAGIAGRVVVSPAAAEDVTQEVFVQLWTNAASIDLDRCSLRGWLSVLAHRRAVDCVRRTERARRRDELTGHDEDLAPVLDLAELAVTRDQARRARAAVAALPDEQRAAVELAFWGGRSYRQVAVELGIPEGTAKSRVRLALAALAAVLTEEAD